MPRTRLPGSFWGTLVRWTAVALVFVLLGFNLVNLLQYRQIEPILSRQMGERQSFEAGAIADGLRASWIRSFIASPDGIYGRILTDRLNEHLESAGFNSITLLDSLGNVIFSTESAYEIGEFFPYIEADRMAFNSALAGIPSSTELYTSGDRYVRGAYAPVADELGRVAWALGIEAGAEYYYALAMLRRNLVIFGILSIVLAVVAGAILLSAAFALKRMERRLLQASAMSSIGQMAAGVAHDIRNPLAIIRGAAESISKAKPEKRDELISFILDEVARIDDTVAGYLTLARPADEMAAPILLGELAGNVANRVRRNAATAAVRIVVSRGEEQPVEVRENALRRCILNIFLNAVEAMPDGGEIRVTTKIEKDRSILAISDDGPGLDRKTASKIFDPFFTTKSNGTGIGLTVSKRIVEDAGGTLDLKTTAPGEGCSFEISFPIIANK